MLNDKATSNSLLNLIRIDVDLKKKCISYSSIVMQYDEKITININIKLANVYNTLSVFYLLLENRKKIHIFTLTKKMFIKCLNVGKKKAGLLVLIE